MLIPCFVSAWDFTPNFDGQAWPNFTEICEKGETRNYFVKHLFPRTVKMRGVSQ